MIARDRIMADSEKVQAAVSNISAEAKEITERYYEKLDREKLKEADRALRPLPYKIGINIARAFMVRKGRNRASAGDSGANGKES